MVILIVEDEALIGMAMRMVLRIEGFRVMGPVGTKTEALARAADERPDLAFVDVRLHGLPEGIDVARELRDRHGTTVIFVTGQPERARAARDVALGVITKPYNPLALLRAVEVAADARAGRAIARAPPGIELFA